MPQGISAAEAVLNAFRGSGLSKAAGLEVAEFPHGGTSVRGMRSKDHIAKAQKILEVPKPALLTDELKLSEPRFRGLSNPLGLYLAERRNSLQHQASTNDQVFDRYVRSLPSLDEAYASGVPLATPLEDVDRLEGLPRLGGVAQMVHGVRVGLARDLAHYNNEVSKAGDHEQLSFDDALWGAVMVRTRGFSCGDGTSVLAPVADFVNHSYLPNARWTCDSGTDAKLTLISKAEIPPGEEILINYKAQSNPGAEAYLKTYGFIEGARPVVWPAAECSKLRAANLQGNAPLLDAARRLVAEKCVQKPVDTPLLVQMMPILSEPPAVSNSKRRLRSFL
mmetsp:Transcript_8633/g.18292  ORF Transcript_8633/g.18292 Transcript_8633/m.18292 type:complete len:335 (-) Transcript_8633:59-1063(-)